MSALFPRWTNTLARLTVALLFAAPVVVLGALFLYQRTPFITGEHTPSPSRCSSTTATTWETTASTAATATPPSRRRPRRGDPAPRELCMNCHAQIWNQSPLLDAGARELLRGPADPVEPRPRPAGLRLLRPLHPREQGRRLRHLPRPRRPDGRASTQVQPLTMGWCLDCHRDPAPHLRPREHITDMSWRPPDDDAAARGSSRSRTTGPHPNQLHHLPPLSSPLPTRCQPVTVRRREALARASRQQARRCVEAAAHGRRAAPAGAEHARSASARRDFLAALGRHGSRWPARCSRLQPPRGEDPPVRHEPPDVTPGTPLHYATALVARRLRHGPAGHRAGRAARPRSRATRPPGSLGATGRLRAGLAARSSTTPTARAAVQCRGQPSTWQSSLEALARRAPALRGRRRRGAALPARAALAAPRRAARADPRALPEARFDADSALRRTSGRGRARRLRPAARARPT